MLQFLRKTLAIAIMAVVGLSALAASAGTVPGKVRVKLQPSVAATMGAESRSVKKAGTLSTPVKALNASLKKIGGLTMRPLFPPNPKFAEKRARHGLDQWYEVTFDTEVTPQQAQSVLKQTIGVQKAEVVRTPVIVGSQKFVPFAPEKLAGVRSSAAMPFNDPRLPAQWHYFNDGSINNAVAGADINLFEAWKTETGKPEVLVAIIDGGVDYTHEDLAANMYINEAELNGQPGVDDDGNGYVDDIYGFNFCTNSSQIYPHSHGTHVAGTVAAVNNNGIGVAGVAGGDGSPQSGIRMLSCQVFDSRQGTSEGDFAQAIVYAAEMGAHIAQCSWGWDAPDYCEQAVLDAIDYFTDEHGGLCIFAAGNMGSTGDYYPACYDKVLSVGSMIPNKIVAPYSNYGSWVDITAPGGILDFGEAWGVLSTLPDNSYGWNEGTSMATPHVSGIAALLLSHYKDTKFSPDMLRSQLESSVNDLYSFNPGKEGLYGTGYIDAAKALNFDASGSAPSAVTEFSLLPAQDNIVVEWVIPEASFNVVDHCVIYYSTEPLTAENIGKARTVTVDTKFLSSGETARREVSNLAPMTTYYFAIQAVSRQGVASEISEVKSASTNAGPKMTVDKQSLDITSGPATFNIGNEDEGLLKWAYKARTVSGPKASMFSTANNIVPFSGKLDGEKIKTFSVVRSDEYVADEYPKDLKYFDYFYARIGDVDTKLPNSMAQMFAVDAEKYPEGFNLTSLRVSGGGGEGAYFEIYAGGSAPMPANLVCSFTPQFFVYDWNIALPEQLYFAPGQIFWVCVHFPAQDNLYPLGLAEATTSANEATNALMSNDLGKTWTRLSDALKGSPYESVKNPTWAITARSLTPDWSTVLDIKPASGTLKQGETQEVTVAAGSQPLVNGDYKFNLRFETNESQANEIVIPVTLNVSGHAPEVKFGKVVDFGSLLVGQQKTLSLEVFNAGYGDFKGSQWGAGLYSDNISSTNENFQGPSDVSSGFPARSTTRFDVTFAPKQSGPQSGQIVFTDMDGRQFKVMVTGVAVDPAKITLNPASLDAGDLEVGAEAKELSFSIVNDGKFPLQYVMPKYSDETIEGASGGDVHKFGYVWTSNLNGSDAFAYDGNPELVDAVDISSQFSDQDWWSDRIDLGFKFPYYGKEYDHVYVTSYGAVAINPYDGNMGYPPVYPGHSYLAGGGWMTAFGSDVKIGPSSKIQYAKVDGKFVVKFINVLASVYGGEYTPISFHIALCSNGDIEMYYDDYDPSMVFNSGRNLYCGIDDPANSDPISVTSTDISNKEYTPEDEQTPEGERYRSFGSGTAVKFVAPAPNMITSIAPASGLIAPGESVTVTASVAASDDMNAGPTVTNLIINSNDIVNPTVLMPFNANITGDRKPVFAVDVEKVDFGSVFRTSEAKRNITVRNNGHAVMNVTSVTVENGKFRLASSEPFAIEAGRAKDITVILPTETEGEVSDIVHIVADAGSADVQLAGKVIGCPEAQLSYESLEIVTDAGNVIDKPLTVTNNGNEPLTYSIVTGEHVNYMPDYSKSTGVAYTSTARIDDKSVSDEWIDIETNGLGARNGLTYYLAHDYIEVELPFEFPFYGKKYTKMYVYNTGFVSFTKRNDDKIWPEPPAGFPNDNYFTNIIAPYWGLHSMDETKTAGIYHHENADRAVISFTEYGNSMNIGVDFQLVLRPDGTFRFVYRGSSNVTDPVIYSPFGLAGITDENGKNSIRLPDRYIQFNNAVEFSPVVQMSLPAGQSDVADIKVNANILGGEYASSITVTTNVPSNGKIEIPVSLTVNGTPEPVLPEEQLEIERAVGQQSTDVSDPMVQMGAMYSIYFDAANSGTAPYTISNIHYEGPMGEDYGWGAEPAFMLFYYGERIDDWTGETVKGWGQYPFESGMPVAVGTDAIRFALPMLPNETAYTPGEYPVKLTFDIEGLGEETQTREINFLFKVTPAPVAYTDDVQGIYIKAPAPDYKGERDVVVANYGEGVLKGTATIDLSGKTEEVGDGGGVAPLVSAAEAKAAKAALAQKVLETIGKPSVVPSDVSDEVSDIFDAPSKAEFDYLRALYHPHSEVSEAVYNYGSGKTYALFKAATEMVAPEDGFNLSHVYTIIHLGQAKNADYKVEIISGSDLDNGNVLASGVFHSGENHSPAASMTVVVPMDKSVFIPGGQTFNIVVTYPVGEEWPATMAAKQDKVTSDRYRAWTEGVSWFDVADMFQDQYGSLGWCTTALETVKGESWLTIDGDGTVLVDPSGETVIKLKVNAASAPLESGNKATLVLKLNDPQQPVMNIPVVLDNNGAPVIESDAANVLVAEGQRQSVQFTVTEPENEDFSVRLDDNGNLAVISAVTGAEAVKAEGDEDVWNVTGVTGPVNVTVDIAPDYGDNGVYTATLSAADKFGSESGHTVSYTVERTNRAPEALAVEPYVLQVGGSTEVLDFNTIFNEPDGEVMTYNIEIADPSVIEAFTSASSAIFVGKAVGETTAVVEATDESGATTANTLTFKVETPAAIDNITLASSLTVWPNPVVETLHVTCADDVAAVTLKLTAINGMTMMEMTEDNVAGQAHDIDVSTLVAGTYVLSVSTDGAAPASFVIIKK